MERGLEQRLQAINLFLKDIYAGDGAIFKAKIIPPEVILKNKQYQAIMRGYCPPNDAFVSLAGIDIIRHDDGNYYVLEDNLRVPSGVSYMLQNRKMSERLFPELFETHKVSPIDHYPSWLLQTLMENSEAEDPRVAVLTPGPYNSAYYEHAYLAEKMGVELVEGQDLFVDQNILFMKTTHGPLRVDVLYRRLDDDFIDPIHFNPDSTLGVPGIVEAILSGNLTITNNIGTGVADDKSIYPFVPDMIKFYLGEEPIINNVTTYCLHREDDLKYTLENLSQLVVKEVHGAGGAGMLVGPTSTRQEIEDFRKLIINNPKNYISQPTLSLSTCGIWLDENLSARHIDLRPYVLQGKETRIIPGGLTRVALQEGSLIVNSSQGGGTKDTWVLEDLC